MHNACMQSTCKISDSGSHKVQHYLEAISNDTEIIWSTTTVKTKNSTNLESGRRPKFKSVEFFVFTLTVNELLKCEKAAFHFHAALFGARSPLYCVLTSLSLT